MNTNPTALLLMTVYSVILGAGYGMIGDIMNIIPKTIFHRSKDRKRVPYVIVYVIRDILFFIIVGITFSVFVYWRNNGKVRFTAILGVITGYTVYNTVMNKTKRKIKEIVKNKKKNEVIKK